MKDLFILLYPLVTVISIFGYLPQIKALLFTNSNCADISLSSWYLWIVSSAISLGYGYFHLKDFMFVLTTGAGLVLMLAVVGLVLYRRWEFKNKESIAVAPAE